jgi:hypothetical protein
MSHRHPSLPWDTSLCAANDLIGMLPELDALREVVEHSDWHDDDVLAQSLRLFHWVRQLPASLPGTVNAAAETVQTLLSTLVDPQGGPYTTRDLLAFAALVHDTGKAETYRRLPDGATRCPGHEAVSARIADDLCARFDFSSAETRFITGLVGAHGEPYALFKRIASLPTVQRQQEILRFEAEHAGDLLPLLLLALGDLTTSQLCSIQPDKYEAIFGFYRAWLQDIWSRVG